MAGFLLPEGLCLEHRYIMDNKFFEFLKQHVFSILTILGMCIAGYTSYALTVNTIENRLNNIDKEITTLHKKDAAFAEQDNVFRDNNFEDFKRSIELENRIIFLERLNSISPQ